MTERRRRDGDRHSEDRIRLLDDGRVRLYETWAWDSKSGSGTGILEEVPESEG